MKSTKSTSLVYFYLIFVVVFLYGCSASDIEKVKKNFFFQRVIKALVKNSVNAHIFQIQPGGNAKHQH